MSAQAWPFVGVVTSFLLLIAFDESNRRSIKQPTGRDACVSLHAAAQNGNRRFMAVLLKIFQEHVDRHYSIGSIPLNVARWNNHNGVEVTEVLPAAGKLTLDPKHAMGGHS